MVITHGDVLDLLYPPIPSQNSVQFFPCGKVGGGGSIRVILRAGAYCELQDNPELISEEGDASLPVYFPMTGKLHMSHSPKLV